jgi:hypothetical protein
MTGVSTEDDLNIITVESMTEAGEVDQVLLTTEDATNWLLDFGALYHVTPF